MNTFEELKDYIFTLPIIDTHEHLPSTEEVRNWDMDVLKEYIRYWPAGCVSRELDPPRKTKRLLSMIKHPKNRNGWNRSSPIQYEGDP